MKTNVQITIESDLNHQLSKLTKIPYKSTYTKSKIKALHMIRDIITDNTTNLEPIATIEEKYLFFSNAYDIAEELIDQIEYNKLEDYEIKDAIEIINKLNIGVK